MINKKITKRDGRVVDFNIDKISIAIMQAATSVGGDVVNSKEGMAKVSMLTNIVGEYLSNYDGELTVEMVQDLIEKVLIDNGHVKTAKAFILYRHDRNMKREIKSELFKSVAEITNTDAKDSDLKRENANIDADTPMGAMIKYGAAISKEFYSKHLLRPEHAEKFTDGHIHIHDFDFYSLTMTCCQIDLKKLFETGFSTGNGYIRTPNDIHTYSALTCIALQSNQNDMHGGQSIPMFDYALADGVIKTFRKEIVKCIKNDFNVFKKINKMDDNNEYSGLINNIIDIVKNNKIDISIDKQETETKENILVALSDYIDDMNDTGQLENIETLVLNAIDTAIDNTDKTTFQAMEALVHNLNTMQSRAGAQVDFDLI